MLTDRDTLGILKPKEYSKIHDGTALAWSSISKVATRSILNPLLWFLGFSVLACCTLVVVGELWVKITAMVFFGTVILIGTASFFHIFHLTPDRLQSEDYQMKKLGLLGDDRNKGHLIESPSISNPGAIEHYDDSESDHD